jgi:hypothetical protein
MAEGRDFGNYDLLIHSFGLYETSAGKTVSVYDLEKPNQYLEK